MAVRNEMTTTRLYTKDRNSKRLRKGSAAELQTLLAAGWHETHRTESVDYVDIRFERAITRVAFESNFRPEGPGSGSGNRPRRNS